MRAISARSDGLAAISRESAPEIFVVGIDVFRGADLAHALDQVVEIHGSKAEVLTARGDGRGNPVRLGGAENEDGPGRRLFDRLQQSVKGFARDLVRFIDDENL